MSGESRDYRLHTSATINLRQEPFLDALILKRPGDGAVVTVWRDLRTPLDAPETNHVTWFKAAYDGMEGHMLLLHDTFEQQFHDITAPILAPETPSDVPIATILDFVPYFSQQDVKAPAGNDCGEASWMMLMLWRIAALDLDAAKLPTVNQLSKLWNKQVGATSWIERQMYPRLADMGFTGVYNAFAMLEWYKERVRAGEPCVALISYGGFLPVNRAINFFGGHYVVVVGADDEHVIISDPLWPDERGAFRRITNTEWERASQKAGIAVTGFVDAAYDAPKPALEPVPPENLLRWYMVAAMIEDAQIATAKEALARLSVRSQWIALDDETIE